MSEPESPERAFDPRRPGAHAEIRTTPPSPMPAPMPGDDDEGGRPGDPGIGRPRVGAQISGPAVDPATLQQPPKIETIDEVFADTEIALPRFLVGSTSLLFLLALTSVFCLFLFAQVLDISFRLSLLALPMQIAGWTLVGILGLICLVACGRFLFLFAKLRANRKVHFKRVRGVARFQCTGRIYDMVRQHLTQYMVEYPLDDVRAQKQLEKQGVTATHLVTLRDARKWLGEKRAIDSHTWILEYRDRFQKVLDSAADNRVQSIMKQIALATAASSNKLIDELIILPCTFEVLTALCIIYNRRFTPMWTAYLVGWILFDTYLSGVVEDAAEQAGNAAQSVTTGVLDHGLNVLDKVMDAAPGLGNLASVVNPVAGVGINVIAGVTKKGTAAAVRGSANALAFRRLARRAATLLQPLEA